MRVTAVHRLCQRAVSSCSQYSVQVGQAELRLDCNRLARFANGSALVHMGDTSALVTAVCPESAADPSPSRGFANFTVDYRQKAAAMGHVPTNWLRRELGPSDQEILTSRLIDRALRPLFPAGLSAEAMLVCDVMSVGQHEADVLCLNGGSLALSLSDIPWSGPVAAVRVVLDTNDAFHINPTHEQVPHDRRKLSLVVSAYFAMGVVIQSLKYSALIGQLHCSCPTSAGPSRWQLEHFKRRDESHVMMLDMTAGQVSADELNLCVRQALQHVHTIVELIQRIQREIGKPKRQVSVADPLPAALTEHIHQYCAARIIAELSNHAHDKISRDRALRAVLADVKADPATAELMQSLMQSESALTVNVNSCDSIFFDLVRSSYRKHVLNGNLRCDGRTNTQSRPILCEAGLYRPLAGSALFQRGQTQVQCTVAFDSPASAFRNDLGSVLLGAPKEKKFMLHYNFPPYATNDVKKRDRQNRRELGHGALAERAVEAVMPALGHTTRLTCEVLESNGSSSMASVCAASLALLDAGVNIDTPVSTFAMSDTTVCGVALGLLTDEDEGAGRYELLTDLMGFEDYVGDMDMKIAGTAFGWTALQLDLKIAGLHVDIFSEALEQAKEAHAHILAEMAGCLDKPRAEMKDGGPVMKSLNVPVHKRAQLMGPSALNLKRIQSETGCELQLQPDGSFAVFAPNHKLWAQADAIIQSLISVGKEPVLENGAIYTAKIVEIVGNGVRVQLFPDQPPVLIPNSQLDARRVQHASALGLQEGQELRVKYYGRDPVSGQIRLSRKMLTMTAGRRLNLFDK